MAADEYNFFGIFHKSEPHLNYIPLLPPPPPPTIILFSPHPRPAQDLGPFK